MGKYDSSLTRVEPIFDWLYEHDPDGHSWISRLLALPAHGRSRYEHVSDRDLQIIEKGWGNTEKALPSPVSLLSWLIRNLADECNHALSRDPLKAQKRQDLLNGSSTPIREALELLRKNPMDTDWHIFEGETKPDVYIETPNVIVVIEGKRTESRATTNTTWMPGRHQIWRHIDCAWETRGRKDVYGFFIVEGIGKKLSEHWISEINAAASDDAVRSSLPHRGPEEQEAIASCYLGGTTWQNLLDEFNIPESVLIDELTPNHAMHTDACTSRR